MKLKTVCVYKVDVLLTIIFNRQVPPQRGRFLPITIDECRGGNEVVLRLHQSGLRAQVDPVVTVVTYQHVAMVTRCWFIRVCDSFMLHLVQ